MVIEPKLFVALPILEESENIEKIINCLQNQSYTNFELLVCINQYDHWWETQEKQQACIDNQKSLDYLKSNHGLDIMVIDKSSVGSGWPKKKGGVGWARKTIMDNISMRGAGTDIIVSIDADTYYPPDYLEKIKDYFLVNNKHVGLALPYYHNLNNDVTDRLILRYEIYMRSYLLNMMIIENPYAYTALGSAMAFPIWAYNKVGGLTPVSSGEDFYFLQKLAKTGLIGIWVDTMAYPSPRFSDRVDFGTGPALIKGNSGNWESYPNYPSEFFDDIKETFDTFGELYIKHVTTPMEAFLLEQFGGKNIWDPLRNNYKDQINFEKACVSKVDGLRILQFLKWRNIDSDSTNKDNLFNLLSQHFENYLTDDMSFKVKNFNYISTEITTIDKIRNLMFDIETEVRKSRLINNNTHYA